MIITSADSAGFVTFKQTVCLFYFYQNVIKGALVALFLGMILSFFLFLEEN